MRRVSEARRSESLKGLMPSRKRDWKTQLKTGIVALSAILFIAGFIGSFAFSKGSLGRGISQLVADGTGVFLVLSGIHKIFVPSASTRKKNINASEAGRSLLPVQQSE